MAQSWHIKPKCLDKGEGGGTDPSHRDTVYRLGYGPAIYKKLRIFSTRPACALCGVNFYAAKLKKNGNLYQFNIIKSTTFLCLVNSFFSKFWLGVNTYLFFVVNMY